MALTHSPTRPGSGRATVPLRREERSSRSSSTASLTPSGHPRTISLKLLDDQERRAIAARDFAHANRILSQRLRLKEQLRSEAALQDGVAE